MQAVDEAGPDRYACAMMYRPVRRIALCLSTALLLVGARPGCCFDFHRDDQGRKVAFANRPISVYLRTGGAPSDLALAAQIKAVQGAIDAWQTVAGAALRLRYGGATAAEVRYDIEVGFDPEYEAEDGEVLAKTLRHVNGLGQLVWADIHLNSRDVQWSGGPLLGGRQVSADLQGVLTHHLGHALGLGHSRDRNATMYFYGTKGSLRTPAADDQRGLRVLWPAAATPTAEGGACDACDTDANCAGGALCLAWPDGARHCARPCVDHDDCAIGFSCGSYSAGKACLPNDQHCKPDAARTGLGGTCASDLACGAGFCQPADPVGFCAGSCQDCPAPAQCVQTNVGALCLLRGQGKVGQPCWSPGDCQSMQCAPSIGGGGRCTQSCASGCPSGYICSAQSNCVKAGGALALPLGWPCASGFDCASGQCVATPGARFESVCSQVCELATDCPSGTGCSVKNDSGWCLPASQSTSAAGLPCPASGQCTGGLLCDQGYFPGLGACRTACNPYAPTPSECGSGEVCVWMSGGKGACRPAQGGLKAYGQPCSALEPCRDDLVCASAGGAPAQCAADCHPATAEGCSSPLACLSLAATAERGICAAGSGPATAVPSLPSAPPNLFARSINLPDVVPAAQWKFTAKPVEEQGGCNSSPAGSWWSLSLIGLAIVARRRRRTA